MSSPMFDATFQAFTLTALSNAFAQGFQAYKKQSLSSIDVNTFLHFAIFSLLITPPNFAFQKFLEDSFPTTVPSKSKADGNASERREPASVQTESKLSWSNTAIKFILDQSLGAPVNTVLFLAVMGMFKGMPVSEISYSIQQDFWPMITAGLRLWPMVCLLNLLVVPFEYRMLVGNLAAFGWGVYMTLRAL